MSGAARAKGEAWFHERARLAQGVESDLDALGRLLDAYAAEQTAALQALIQDISKIVPCGAECELTREILDKLRAL